MEILHQVRLLLRRNVALRLRQPFILALELLWPVAIFLVVMSARNAIPPVAKSTCHYKAWALPSAGVVPFVQSMICNIDECQNKSEYESIPTYKGSSVRELVANTLPLIMDENITELVQALPKGMRLMRVAVDALSGPDLSALLDDGFPIRNLLKDSNQTREILHRINLTDEEIELTLNSSIQLPQILELLNQNNFCDTNQDSESYSGEIFSKLMEQLCSLDSAARKDFFNQLKNQLDVRNIVKTMGLAMSELGRLDISEILENIGGLLISLQSSNILQEDVLSMVSNLLEEVQFDQIDTDVLSDLINDLEPLYKNSEWSSLIYILKDLELSMFKGKNADSNKKIGELPDGEEISMDENKMVSFISTENKMSAHAESNGTTPILNTVMSLLETGVNILRIVPHQTSSQARRAINYIKLLTDLTDDIENSLKNDNSSAFIDTMGDLLGAFFLTVVDASKLLNGNSTTRNYIDFCNMDEFQQKLNSTKIHNAKQLQQYACRIAELTEKMMDSSKKHEKENLNVIHYKLKQIISTEKYTNIYKNLERWATNTNAENNGRHGSFSDYSYKNESIDDLVSVMECAAEKLNGILNLNPDVVSNAASSNSTLGIGGLNEMDDKFINEKNIVLAISKMKDIITYFKSNPLFASLTKFFKESDTVTILTELEKLVNAAKEGNNNLLPAEILRLIPALIFATKDLKTGLPKSLSELNSLPSIVSLFVDDIEPFIWNSISPKMVRDFSEKNSSRSFCIDTNALEATQLHWKWMLCKDSSPASRLPLPSKIAKEQVIKMSDSRLPLKLDLNSTETFDAKVFSRVTLQISSQIGFLLKTALHFLKPVESCEKTCNADAMLKKMCFLSRMQNVKKSLHDTEMETEGVEHDEDHNDILKQLQPLFPVDEKVIESYNIFMDAARFSAQKNYTDWKDIVKLLVSSLRFLESVDGRSHKLRPVFHVITSLSSLIKNRVSDTAQSSIMPMVRIENVLPDSPLTQEVVKSFLPLLPEVASTFFWTSLAPGKLLDLVGKSKKNISVIMTELCDSSLTKYLYNPALSEDEFAKLGEVLCQHEYFDLFEEIFQDPDIQEIVFEASSTDDISWEDMHNNILETVTLLMDLSSSKRADLSLSPPIAKWQKMATDIQIYAQDPSVILYILSNKLFYGFCNMSTQSLPNNLQSFFSPEKEATLYRELCSMSEPSFSYKLVDDIKKRIYQPRIEDKDLYYEPMIKNSVNAFLGMSPVRSILDAIFDLNLSTDSNEEQGITFASNAAGNSNEFADKTRKRIMTAIKKAYSMVNNMTNQDLSGVILGSNVPELLQEFSSFILETDGKIDLKHFFKKGYEGNKLLLTLFRSNPEKQRLERYVKVLKSFFTKPDNFETLKMLCDVYRDKQKSKVSQESVNTVFEMMCIDSPRKWSVRLLLTPMNNFSELWYQIDELLSVDIKNQTREDYFRERKEDMWTSIENILKSGIHINDGSTLQTSAFYFSILKSVLRNLDESGLNFTIPGVNCFTKTKQHAIQNSTHKLMRSIPDAEFVACGLLNKNISGFYRWLSHSASLKNTIQQFTEKPEKDERCKHSWKWLLPIVDDLENFYLRISMDLSESDAESIKQCLQNMKQSTLIQSIEIHTDILQKAAKFLMSLGAPAGQFKEVKQQLLGKISQHLPAYFKIPELLQNQTTFSSDDGLDQELMDALQDTAINFNLLRRQGFSADMLRNKICRRQSHLSSGSFYPTSTTLYSRSKMKEVLCKNNSIEKIINYIEKEDIKNKIRASQERDFFSGVWLQNLIGSSNVLIDVVRKLSSFLSEIKIQSLYDVFQLFTKPQVIQNVADSFEKLTGVFEPIFPDSSLIETLHQILDGLKAFKSLSQLANFSFLYDPNEVFGRDVEQVLLVDLKIEPTYVSEFMKSKIDLKQAKMIPDSDKVTFCNRAGNESILCTLSNYKKTVLSGEHLQDLVFQRFLYSFGTLGIEGVLKEAEVDAQEAAKTLHILSSAPAIVNKLTSHLETVTEVMIPDVKLLFRKLEEGSDWIATPEALAVGGQILCGKPLTSLNRRFQLLAPEEAENKIEEKELLRLPTDFCRHGYKEIMKMRGGAILWGFLKPLFRGKILFSPKNYEPALHIIAKINETFNSLEDQMKFIKAAAEGSTGLHYLQRKNETLSSLQKFFASNAVSKFIKSSSWGAALSWLDAPNTSSRSLLHLVELVGNVTECISLDRFIGFDSEVELEAAAATLHDRREFIAAIVFAGYEETEPNQPENTIRISEYLLPKKVSYKIRMDIDNVPTTEYTKYRWWRPYPYDDFFEDLRYFRGFIQLQDTIDAAIISIQTDSIEDKSVKKYLQQFPYPCHQSDKFGTLLKGSMPAVMTISWVFIVAFLVRERVLDRELELDATLRVMGLKKVSSWMAWFLTGLTVLLVSVIGIVVVLKWGGITPNSDATILFLFVADFAVLLIAYCQLMSTFFKRASTAALLSVLLYVLSFFPFLLFVTWELNFLYWHKLLSCVLVSTSFCFGCLYLNRYEDQGQGVHWSNLWHSPVADDSMNFGTTLVAMALCALGYFFLSWYVARISLGYKTKKPFPWYFMIPSPAVKDDKVFENSLSNSQKKAKKAVEAGDQKTPKKIGISIKNVHAVYSKKGCKEWRALSGLNIELFEDHITALLGHNGAGKTTTIKLLTGRIQPTSGSINLYDLDIPQQLPAARKLIGFCPQNNTLYDKLTVKEHLYLFAQLKGLLDEESIEKDVESMLRNLNLVEKQDECSEKLSGGQRRRLCVGIAFIGGSKVIILDEPTSSVDPVARRSIWDLILSYKKGRTILFTTHHLDEADILSDRVAILHKGRMLCSDSPLQLKVRFGSGYRLSLFPGSEKLERDERDSGRASSLTGTEDLVNVDSDGVMEFIQGYVPDATLLENDDSHLVVSLPAEPLTTKPLSEFFAHLQKCLHLWGFHSCSLSSATLEEVFLTLCRLEDAKAAHSSDKYHDTSPFRVQRARESIFFKGNENNKPKSKPVAIEITDSNYSENSFFCLKFNQMGALLRKRYWHTKKNWKALISSIVMPCVFIALAMGLAVGRPQRPPDPSIKLTPSLYSNDDHKTVSFFSWNEPTPFLGSTLFHTLQTNYSGGEICDRILKNCHHSKAESFLMKNMSPRCLCESECPANIVAPKYSFKTADQIVFNLSNIDIPQYLLDSYLQLNERRYGGWTIEESNYNEDVVKTWFENSGYHAAPAYLNTINNAILKGRTGYDFDIQTWSHPLRLSVEQLGRESLLQRLAEVGIAFVFLIGLSLVPCTFAIYIVGERQSEQKRLQMVTGAIGPVLYWSVAFIWDIGIVFFTSLISAAIVGSFALPAFYQRDNFRAVYTLIFLYGWATTPITYLCSRFFKEGSLAFMVIFTSHLFIGLVIMFALVSLRMIGISKDVTSTLEIVQKFSLTFPQYSLVGGLADLNENQIRTEIFEQFGQDIYTSPFRWNSLGPNFVALFVQGIIFFVLTVLIEIVPWRYWFQRLIFGKRQMNQEVVPSIEDSTKYLLQIHEVSQIYHTKAGRRYAVDNLTLNIPVGESFGLVGANGAGKTTLFRILIGQIQPTSGKIISVGLKSRTSRKERFLGYCPQKDALDGLLTPRQHLKVYAGLRGIPARNVPKVVEHCLESLELDSHADRPVNTLSGGTKRKLCTAIATLGDPELVLLDEPTSGMDPATRRLVWKNISHITESGRSVILTSHSIEDCDVLCSRLGIMVNGKIACMDSPTKLKSRLGTGYMLSFRISENFSNHSSLINFIQEGLPTARIQIHSGRRIELILPDENVSLSNMFCQLEVCAKEFGIEDLAIDPTTLDQVFVNFVRQQSDALLTAENKEEPLIVKEENLEICCTKL